VASADVLQGTLDLLVLKALSLEPMHGWGISQRIQQLSAAALQVGQGSLYPALYRLQKKALIKGSWRTTVHNREAKYYTLTPAGTRVLSTELADWRRFAAAVDLVMAAQRTSAG
jgi:PadR family transcriptional regulator PadR